MFFLDVVDGSGGFSFDWVTSLATMIVTSLVTYLTTRPKEKKEIAKAQTEVEANELDNVEKAISIWRNLAQDMKMQVDALSGQVKEFAEEVSRLRKENAELKDEREANKLAFANLDVQIQHLTRENSRLANLVSQMKNNNKTAQPN